MHAVQTVTLADQKALAGALDDYEHGRIGQALPALTSLAARYPGNSTVQTAAGMAALESGALAQGVPYLQRAHQLNPQATMVTENLGIALLHLDRAAEALPLLRQARIAQASQPAAHLAEAQALLLLKRYAEAAGAFQAAAQCPGATLDADQRHDWALTLLRSDHAREAASVLQAAPGNAATEELMGEAEEKLGHYPQAFAHFKQAAQLDPSEANLLAYGNELLQHWTFPAAIDILKYGYDRYPASASLETALGVGYFGNNDFAHAAEVFGRQLVARPEDASAANLLGRSCSAELVGAVAACESLLPFAEAHPGNAPAALYAAIALLHNSGDGAHLQQAEALLRQAIAADARLPEAWYQLAVLQQQRQQWAESVASLQHALELRPAYAEAHYRLARAFGHTGRKEEAQQQIALQQQSAQAAKDADNKRMQEVMTFLTATK